MNIWINRFIIVFQYIYETRIATFLAEYCWFPWWPLYVWVKNRNICFVINIAEGTGQVLPELDNFFHALYLKEINTNKKYVWLRTRNDFSKALVPLYRRYFYYAKMSNILYDACLPMLLKWHDITYNAGMSGLHWQLPKSGTWEYPRPWQTYLFLDTKKTVVNLWRNWYRRRSSVPQFVPLKNYGGEKLLPDKQLLNFLDNRTERIALVHIKENVMNATAMPTEPATYLPALRHAVQQGYRLVFVGRERFPKEFDELEILNYSESAAASFMHDLQLFAIASLAITGGSGIAWIADCLGTPVLYLNSWHIFMPPATQNCIYLPALMRDKGGKLLSFSAQFQIYLNVNYKNGDSFPHKDFEPVNVTSEDILEGLQELLLLKDTPLPLSKQQEIFNHLHPLGWTTYAQSRIGQAFIEKHGSLLR